jgi:hypothetical protein
MATTYSQQQVALNEMRDKIVANRNKAQLAKQMIDQVQSELAGMTSLYTPVIQDINAAATANPGATAEVIQKLQKDKLVEEYTQLLAIANQLKTATSAIGV